MTAWVTISNAQVDAESPVTSPLMTALRDNPKAIAEGDAAAPRIKPVILHARHKFGTGTSGGTAVGATFTTRPFNTLLVNDISGASLASSVFTLPAGSYEIDARCLFFNTANTVLRLWNVTDSAMLVPGMPNIVGSNVSSMALLFGRFTLAASKNVTLEYFCSSGVSDGLGKAISSGIDEIFSDMKITKIG